MTCTELAHGWYEVMTCTKLDHDYHECTCIFVAISM